MNNSNRDSRVNLRRAAATDAPVIRMILWKTWMATYAPFIPVKDLGSYFEEHYNEGAVGELLGQKSVEGHIAECDMNVAGIMITRMDEKEGRFYVSSLYVLPEFQGKGIGRALLSRAEQMALSAGVKEIWLGVMAQNAAALSWYRALGFTFLEELPFQMGKTCVTHLIGSMPLGTHVG